MKVLRRADRDPEPLIEAGQGPRRAALAVTVGGGVAGLVAGGGAGAGVVGRRPSAATKGAA
ncbi:MAG: hypothetical protein ACJ74K_00050, partial [Actinomycetes bacterium]